MKILMIVVMTLALRAHAQLLTDFTGGEDLSVGPGTAGYSFTVGSQSLTLQALGVWASGGTLNSSHEVGVWDSAAHLLATALVPPTGAVAIGGFYYEPIPALTLEAGQTYKIAAQYADVDFDQAKGNCTAVTLSGASYGHAFLSTGTGFDYPNIDVSAADFGFFGPNASLAAVPEPESLGLAVAAALLGLAILRKPRL